MSGWGDISAAGGDAGRDSALIPDRPPPPDTAGTEGDERSAACSPRHPDLSG
jgi:hypothetical protein